MPSLIRYPTSEYNSFLSHSEVLKHCLVWVEKDDEIVDGKSIMGLMMLAAGKGEKIKITVVGIDAKEALKCLVELVKNGFNDIED